MGVEYRGVIIVGYTREEFEQCIENVNWDQYFNVDDYEVPDFHDAVEFLSIDQAGPYYDADTSDCIFGDIVKRSGTYAVRELDARELLEGIAACTAELQRQFGLTPKLYLMAEGF